VLLLSLLLPKNFHLECVDLEAVKLLIRVIPIIDFIPFVRSFCRSISNRMVTELLEIKFESIPFQNSIRDALIKSCCCIVWKER